MGDETYPRGIELQGSGDDEPVALAAKKKKLPEDQQPPELMRRGQALGLQQGLPGWVPGMPPMMPRQQPQQHQHVAMAAKKKGAVPKPQAPPPPVPKQQAPPPPVPKQQAPIHAAAPTVPLRLPVSEPEAPRSDSTLVITMGLDNFESNPEGQNTSIFG